MPDRIKKMRSFPSVTAGGWDLIVEKDAGDEVRILTGNQSRQFWEDIRGLANDVIAEHDHKDRAVLSEPENPSDDYQIKKAMYHAQEHMMDDDWGCDETFAWLSDQIDQIHDGKILYD